MESGTDYKGYTLRVFKYDAERLHSLEIYKGAKEIFYISGFATEQGARAAGVHYVDTIAPVQQIQYKRPPLLSLRSKVVAVLCAFVYFAGVFIAGSVLSVRFGPVYNLGAVLCCGIAVFLVAKYKKLLC